MITALDYSLNFDLLYCFDNNTKLIGQQTLKSNVLEICVGKDSVLILGIDSDNNLTCEKLSLSMAEAKKVTNNVKYRAKEKIIKDYNAAKPNNKDPNKLYTQLADTEEFSTCGAVSNGVLEDGLRVINFYRRL